MTDTPESRTPVEPVRFENGRPMLLAGLRRQHPYAAGGQDIPAQWQEFEPMLPLPGQVGATTYGAMCGTDAGGFEYMCGVEVGSFEGLPRDLGRMRILAQRYAVFLHRGHVSGLRDSWERILGWLSASSYESAQKPDFERYDERFDPKTGSGDVEIWISIAETE